MMNQSFDYNGHVVAPSKPTKVLRTVKKTIHIDSGDRDKTKFVTNGDFVIYLPRTYKNVVSLSLTGAIFPPLIDAPETGKPSAIMHSYSSNTYSSDSKVNNARYFFIDIEGLNKTDECAVSGDKSTFIDGFFAKIKASINDYYTIGDATTGMIIYSNKSDPDNISYFTPPIENLDRLHIRTRLHSQQGNTGFVYWTSDGSAGNPAPDGNLTSPKIEYSLTLEIEYLENGFDSFSSFETRLGPRN